MQFGIVRNLMFMNSSNSRSAKRLDWVNDVEHTSHVYGFSPLCILVCSFKVTRLNERSQTKFTFIDVYGFSSLYYIFYIIPVCCCCCCCCCVIAHCEVTFLGLAQAISSLWIPFRAGTNRKVSEH